MVDLMKVYTDAGFSLAANELPDYLPVVLEFLSRRPSTEADEMLSDCAHIVRNLGDELRRHGSRYDAVPAALLAIIGETGLSVASKDKMTTKDELATKDELRTVSRLADEASIDEDWMDAPVIFGPEGAPDCKPVRPASTVIKFMPRQN
jgi:nitrate reductase delta subunit